MSDAQCPIEMIKGIPVVTAPEEIDSSNAGMLLLAVLTSAEHGYATYVVDMTRTEFCDCAAVNVLILAHRRALAEGGELRLVIPRVAVLRAIPMGGVDHPIPSFSTLEDALAPTPAVMIRPSRASSARIRPPGA